MNIEILQDHIRTFTREVVNSGFKRDLDDYAASLPASQNNILALREIAGKVLSVIDHLYTGDLPDGLKSLLPREEIRPFTEVPHDSNLRELIENTEIPQPEFFNQLTNLINQLRQQIEQNVNEVTKIKEFITPYISKDVERIAKDDPRASIEERYPSKKAYLERVTAVTKGLVTDGYLLESDMGYVIEQAAQLYDAFTNSCSVNR